MCRLYFFFNIICLYLAIKSALGVELDGTDQKFSEFRPSAHDGSDSPMDGDGVRRDDDGGEGVSKRAAAMWFGPRLGKRTLPGDLHDELVEEFDSEPLAYVGEQPQKLANELVAGAPYVVLLLTAKTRKPQPLFFHTVAPRLGRRDSVGENHQRPPFAPRLGRNLPFSPRLGRSFTAGYPLPVALSY
ncbi:PBAN-type neuropeptides-like [Anopheles cruzii]|uniref:PBAN-type neuropeptides-like n=1 Tax=Anopheles cruzii TaxID=68878 RepID=UPI0022EC3ADD|nr:PBAN-type neuropeptides-like [Anopheles cruzii]